MNSISQPYRCSPHTHCLSRTINTTTAPHRAAAVRLMVSRGLKPTPYQSPGITLGQPLVVIIPEYKEAAPGPKVGGRGVSVGIQCRGAGGRGGAVCVWGGGAARGADQLKCRRDTCTVCAPLSGCQPLHPPHPTPHPTPCTGGGYPALHLPRAAGRARRAGGGGGSGRGWELGDGAHDAALCCAMTSAPRHPAMPSTVDASQAGWALRPKMAREVACRDACVPHSLRWPAYRIRAGTRTPSSTASRPASRCRSWCEGKTVWHGVM